MTDLLLVFCTFPDIEKARQIGTILTESQLAACVNLCPAVESIYRWQGKIETGTEVLAIFKTTEAAFSAFEVRLRELHPYEVPEIVALRPCQVSGPYAEWVRAEVL
ncbi:MAG TPA: divalent-cation tolerance protein CutA [Prosthecobacter sp.]|nr:divalent-cation tolerance protein CutA [Prosthecobacter sp.]